VAWYELRFSYDRVAARYEARFVHELDGKPRDRELLTAFADSVEGPVLDIGCGPGQIGAFVRRGGRWVAGVDFSPVMAQHARLHLDASTAADMRRLPFSTGSVGGVLAFYSVIHVRRPELPLALAEFNRVLRPAGRVLFSAHDGEGELKNDRFLDEPVPFVATMFHLDELVAASEAAGFDITLAEQRPSYPTESGTVRLYVEGVKRLRH
jgi:SAM-dependent methyltransferase